MVDMVQAQASTPPIQPSALEAAILRTVLYADVFDAPMTVPEIHHFLIHDGPVSLGDVQQTLDTSAHLQSALVRCNGYLALQGRDALFPLREQREAASETLWPQAVRYGRWLARLPFVRMVGLTGALAVHNPSDQQDDLDYMIVTVPGRVWTARAFAVLLVRLARLWGVDLCPNYVVAEDALEQGQHTLFMAHQVAQVVPIYGQALYDRLRSANRWASRFLPNAQQALYPAGAQPPGRVWGFYKRALEVLLGGRPGDMLERWERERKLRRFARQMQTAHSAAQLDETQVKGHFDDHGHPSMQAYEERLQQHHLAWPPAGRREDDAPHGAAV